MTKVKQPDRARRQRIRRMQNSIDRITHADFNYFKRFPHRRYRVRVAGRAEIEQAELEGQDMHLAPGKQHYSVVLSVAPEIFVCLVVQGPTDADPDAVDEETARALFKKILCETVRDRLTQAELLAIDEAFNERH